jgi:endonuclease/exonuclease/phosphatase family metal-dependent hydrolase
MNKLITLLAVPLFLAFGIVQPDKYVPDTKHYLKFISFNIRLGSDWSKGQDGEYCWDNRKATVVRMIRQENPDAIGLQEVLPNQLAYLDSALPDYQRYGIGREDGKSRGEHMAIFLKKDRLELVKCGTYWLSQTPDSVSMGWDAGCHRTVTMVVLKDKTTQRQMLYMNTHLDHMGRVARAESTKLLARLANQWATADMPILIGGDMNTTDNDTIFNSFHSIKLENCRILAPVTDTANTYNAFGKGAPCRIDHFFQRGLTLRSFRTLNSDYGIPYISDHYPVELIFHY